MTRDLRRVWGKPPRRDLKIWTGYLFALQACVAGLLFAALHLWPAHG